MSVDPLPWLVARLAYALLFGSAAVHKLRDLPGFRRALAGYAILPAATIPAASIAIAVVEAAIALALGASLRVEAAAGAGMILLAIYAAGIAINLRRGRRTISCGCGGVGGERPIGSALVARNGLLVLGLGLLLLPCRARALGWMDWTSASLAVLASALLYAAADVALANAARLVPVGGVR